MINRRLQSDQMPNEIRVSVNGNLSRYVKYALNLLRNNERSIIIKGAGSATSRVLHLTFFYIAKFNFGIIVLRYWREELVDCTKWIQSLQLLSTAKRTMGDREESRSLKHNSLLISLYKKMLDIKSRFKEKKTSDISKSLLLISFLVLHGKDLEISITTTIITTTGTEVIEMNLFE